jgi:D-apionolactonase
MTLVTTPTTLSAGPWSAVVDPDGSLSRVSWDGIEILRGLGVVVRTNTWLTVTPESTVTIRETDSGVTVEVEATHRGPEVDFSWKGKITCEAEGEFRYSCDGISTGVTSTNRIGLVALHSLNWSGLACVVTHTDGSTESTRYPELVSPHQPMKDIAALSQALREDRTLTIAFEGDVFEMEDQRNWTDASYKTYSRPLELPFPYSIDDGEEIHQAVTLRVQAGARGLAPPTSGTSASGVNHQDLLRSEGGAVFRWPELGLGTDPTSTGLLTPEVVEELRPAHLRVDVVCEGNSLWGEDVLKEVGNLGVALELAIHVGVSPAGALQQLAALVQGLELNAVMVYDTSSPSTTRAALDAVVEALGPVLLERTTLFVGTDDNFTELNRHRVFPREMGAYGLCFAPSPQVHDSRERAMIDTAEAIPAIISTARHFSDGAPIAVSPLAFTARRNIHAPGRVIDRVGRDSDSVDERFGSMFSCLWLVSTLHPLITGQVERVTVAEIVGPRGIVSTQDVHSGDRSDLAGLWAWLSRPRTEITVLENSNTELVAWADVSEHHVGVMVANRSATERFVTVETPVGSRSFPVPPMSVHFEEIHD